MDGRTAEILKGFELLIPIRDYIKELKNYGYDMFFRLGTSSSMLLISRSVNFGLREDQKYIRIEALSSNDFIITFKDGVKVYREYRIQNLNDQKLSNLIKTLKGALMD